MAPAGSDDQLNQSLGLAMTVGAGLPSSATENTSSSTEIIAGTSRTSMISSSVPLYCTYPSCTANEEDKVFTGKGATSAHKRHMDSHNKPYICPDVKCPRHTNGFSRRDNLANHIKIHRNKKKQRSVPISEVANPLGVLGGSTNASRPKGLRGMSGHERKKLMNTLLVLIELGFDDEHEDENDSVDDIDIEQMEEDED